MTEEKEELRPPIDTGVGKGPTSSVVIAASALFFLALSGLLLYALWQFWPPSPTAPGEAPPASGSFNFFGAGLSLSREKNFLLIVAIGGALGAMAYILRSFFRYVGDRALTNSWLLLYYLSPMVGAILGTLIYIVLRAGLITSTGIGQTDPFGFVAVSALVGLFSAQAAEKLKQIFEAIFVPSPSAHESTVAVTEGQRPPREAK